MSFEVEYFTLNATDSSNRYISLAGTPLSSNNVAMDLIGGTAQALTGDFGVDGTDITWDGVSYGLYNMMSSGEKVRVIYDKS